MNFLMQEYDPQTEPDYQSFIILKKRLEYL